MTLIDSTALSERMMPFDGENGVLNASGFATAWKKPSDLGAKRLVAILVVTGPIADTETLTLKFVKADDAAGTGALDFKSLVRPAHVTANDNAILMLDLDYNEMPRDVDQAGVADKPFIRAVVVGGATTTATGTLIIVAGDLADTPEAGAGRSAHITEIKRS